MDTPSDTSSAATPRRWFYGAAVLLLILGVTAALFQKGRESAAAVTVAKRIATGVQVQQIIQDAERWEMVSLAAVFFAMASWGIAVWRRENRRGAWVVIVSFLALYVGLELMMV